MPSIVNGSHGANSMRHRAFSTDAKLAFTSRSQAKPVQSGTAARHRDASIGLAAQSNGPPGAFVEGQESETRQQLFGRIAPVYDQLNNTLSLGQHRVWKRMTVKWAEAKPGDAALDVCCGSGDLAFVLAEAVGPSGKVQGLDFAQQMLADAERRQQSRHAACSQRCARIEWVQGDALELPFPDRTFDAVTMGYGLRNVASIPRALEELGRVLKPGAKAAILDFNNSDSPVVDSFQAWALENIAVPMARSYNLEEEYQYLRPSIKRFPKGREQVFPKPYIMK
ncbi:hypothetical protein CVIRNUC_008137 [Coccomyxa viridis]|uniref:2-phytyl-1,4-beta-naphthoquinone methyltransferase, chloroplastic n=1 Tax=Coccomyxa viridis TaxID=1274662 RepID=A0AAV1IFH5_9CHLO|nr:hypothetical protein CVIRNUC_008137 [Coccomyxa viridis]